jgi:hypothetical protein
MPELLHGLQVKLCSVLLYYLRVHSSHWRDVNGLR